MMDIQEEDEVDLDLIKPVLSYSDETKIFQDSRPKSNYEELTKTSYTFVSKTDIDLDYLNLDTIVSEENSNQYDTFDLKHSSVGDLETHSKQKNHEEKKQFKCDECNKSFTAKSSLNGHIRAIHERKKDFKCNVCAATFSFKQSLKKHTAAIHEGKKSLKCHRCEKCDKLFVSKQCLKRHVSTVHEGKKPFTCDECGNRFTTKSSLKAHIMAVHKGKRPFKCTKCEATFNYKTAVTRHIAIVHDEKKPLKCDVVLGFHLSHT
jgi:uncharacterized Zn-finger protein